MCRLVHGEDWTGASSTPIPVTCGIESLLVTPPAERPEVARAAEGQPRSGPPPNAWTTWSVAHHQPPRSPRGQPTGRSS